MTTQRYKENFAKIDWSNFKPRERKSPGFFDARSGLPAPMVMPDTPSYISPVTGLEVDGRVARREDLKRSGCREVDPSEFKPTYRNEKYRKRYSKQPVEE